MDILCETKLGLAAAGREHNVNPATVFRWMFDGFRGIRLEYARVGRRLVTSREALARFFAKLQEGDEARRTEREQQREAAKAAAPAPIHMPSSTLRRKQIEQAKAELRAAGVMK